MRGIDGRRVGVQHRSGDLAMPFRPMLSCEPPASGSEPESPLCFKFEAQDLHRALDLADELRRSGNRVRVRPGPSRLLGSRRWTVALTTRPTLPHPMILQLWEEEMRETADRCPGCRFVGWWWA